MNVDRFLTQHGLSENPFRAEEARHDPIFDRLSGVDTAHPDFAKILGQIEVGGWATEMQLDPVSGRLFVKGWSYMTVIGLPAESVM